MRENGGMSVNPEESAVSGAQPEPDAQAVAAAAPEESPGSPEPSPEERVTVTEDAVRVQRSPRYFRFMLTGAVVFAIVALILTFSFPENPVYDRGAVFGFLLTVGVALGVALGALAALAAARAAARRARTVRADRIDVYVGDDG
ncbi:hypothetical protein Lxx22770 [Leifsonia xyli subsp. xyli str. CTCB07]|uniref:Uncharacterized protein n=2 Tax=Leifsonia xyli TaxID=1575 RepID=Q6ACE8_LEIXX|nr:hypothetical protein Lxx22770 [Leifsonia xyli subsp. xyli str. CTCB07]